MWKDFYFLCGGHAAFLLRLVAYGGAVGLCLYKSSGSVMQFGLFSGIASTAAPFAFSVDAAVMASRIFRLELRDQTLTALATLPLTIRQIAHRKMFACVLAAVPGFLGTFVVQILSLQHFLTAQVRLSGMIPMAPLVITKIFSSWVQALLIVHLVAWLSLYMKRGALPLGFVLTYAANMLFSILFVALVAARGFLSYAASNTSGAVRSNISFLYWSPMLGGVISLAVIAVLHHRSLRRLELLAGES